MLFMCRLTIRRGFYMASVINDIECIKCAYCRAIYFFFGVLKCTYLDFNFCCTWFWLRVMVGNVLYRISRYSYEAIDYKLFKLSYKSENRQLQNRINYFKNASKLGRKILHSTSKYGNLMKNNVAIITTTAITINQKSTKEVTRVSQPL